MKRFMITSWPLLTLAVVLLGGVSASAQYEQYPVWQSTPTFTGQNPWTGGWDTQKTVLENSVFDPYRELSKQFGAQQTVDQPLYDRFGKQIGWQKGVRWYNPVTKVWHGEVEEYTPNGTGGLQTSKRFNSTFVPNGKSNQGKTLPASTQPFAGQPRCQFVTRPQPQLYPTRPNGFTPGGAYGKKFYPHR